jgi:TonB family protein
MSLTEFLRQWQSGRLAVGVVLSVVLHLALIALGLGVGLPKSRYDVRRGEPLIVELPRAPDSPPPGVGAPPASQPAAPQAAAASPPRPAPAAPSRPAPAAPSRPAPVAPRPESVAARPEPPAPRSEPTPARPAEKAVPAPEPAPRAVAAKPEPQPVTPQPVTPSDAGTVPVPPPTPVAEEPKPAPRAVADAAPPHPAPAPQPSSQQAPQPSAQQPPQQLAAVPPPSQPAAPPPPDALSALRRGGAGGAGGSGEGRAGFEGEPIPLDSANPRYSDYLERVRRAIKEKWGYPCVKNDVTRECEYKTAQLVVEFGIAKNGKVPYVAVVRSSGYPIYDDYAVNAIKLADFPPIPDSFSKKGERITATFSYVVQASLTNILR